MSSLAGHEGAIVTVDPQDAADRGGGGREVLVSEFDYSVDRFFEASEMVASLCGEATPAADEKDLQRLSSMITFLTEWKYFNYEPKHVTFAFEGGTKGDTIGGIQLPQFSSASFPKNGDLSDNSESLNCKDFVLHAGGSVWALDWCPRIHRESDSYIKCEYLAVAAHPPNSSPHQIGLPLSGRGLVQIWCILNVNGKETTPSMYNSKPKKGRPRKFPFDSENQSSTYLKKPSKTVQKDINLPKRGRGRPRKSGVATQEVISESSACLEYEESQLSESNMFASSNAKKVADCRKRGNCRQGTDPVPKSFTNDHVSGGENVVTDSNVEPSYLLKCNRSRQNQFVSTIFTSANCFSADSCHTMDKEEPLASQVTNGQCSYKLDSNDLYNSASRASGTRQFNGHDAFNSEGLAETDNGMLPFQQEGNKRTKKNNSAMDICDSSSIISLKVDISASSFGEGAFISSNVPQPDKGIFSMTNTSVEPHSRFLVGLSSGTSVERRLSKRQRKPNPKYADAALEEDESPRDPLPMNRNLRGRPRKLCLGSKISGTADGNDTSQGFKSVCLSNFAEIGDDLSVPSVKKVPICNIDDAAACLGYKTDKSSMLCVSEVKKPPPVQQYKEKSRKKTMKGISQGDTHSTQSQKFEHVSSVSTSISSMPVTDVSILRFEGEAGEGPALCPSAEKFAQAMQKGRKKSRNELLKEASVEDRCHNDISKSNHLNPVFVEFCNMSEKSRSESVTDACVKATSRTFVEDTLCPVEETPELILGDCAVDFNASKCAPERGTKRYSKRMMKNSTFQPALPSFSKENTSSNIEGNFMNLLDEDLGGQEVPLNIDKSDSVLHKNIALPRLVLCLAHMGKVAWDAKWRPLQNTVWQSDYRMGYLAVLLGNGSLEVWEVPLPGIVKTLYNSCNKEGSDPRFVKMNPVFKCSELKSGDKQCIPLAMEWSPSAPCDLLVAGCHDGTVAVWKFFASESSPETKPLLCFNADNVPVRSVSWAPNQSDTESSNLIITAGGDCLKFWDLRDPYLPLWSYTYTQRHILSVDWLMDPRWIVLSYDDGFIRILNLCKAASNILVTGNVPRTSKTGIYSIACSPFAIWSAEVSRATGLLSYCGVDGRTNYFKLQKSVIERNAAKCLSHFPCGSLLEEHQSLIIKVPDQCVSLDPISRKVPCPMNLNKADGCTTQVCKDLQETPTNEVSLKPKASLRKEDTSSEAKNPACFVGEEDSLGLCMRDAGPKEVFPPKIIAMHRVRWNKNHGSERWLCYGGAAGIVRCQDISLTSSTGRM